MRDLRATAEWIIARCEAMAADRDAPVITAIDAADALRAALQAQEEPDGWILEFKGHDRDGVPFYTDKEAAERVASGYRREVDGIAYEVKLVPLYRHPAPSPEPEGREKERMVSPGADDLCSERGPVDATITQPAVPAPGEGELSFESRNWIVNAMTELASLPCGGIDDDKGPTLKELDEYVTDQGQPWGNDAMYHSGRVAWLMLRAALAAHRASEKGAGK